MLNAVSRTWGTDPEAFFSKGGQIIGSEKLIPEKGIVVDRYAGKIVRDGVQFELNPTAGSVETVGANIAKMYHKLTNILSNNPGVSVDFNGVVEVSRKELQSLTPRSRVLGCMPSYNVYGEFPITVDPVKYRKRSSGGHIHVALYGAEHESRRRAVPLFDIMVGLFSVLVDRDPGAAERRKNYGRAGEFRLPNYGLEYRTTSNFWLRDYVLMTFVFGMSNLALAVSLDKLANSGNAYTELGTILDIDKVRDAIDTNSYPKAVRIVKKLIPWFQKYVGTSGVFPLNANTIPTFLRFTEQVQDEGIEQFFTTQDILQRWQNKRIPFVQFISTYKG